MLTHCTQQWLPNLAHLIGVVLPDLMDGDNGGASTDDANDVCASHKLGGGGGGGRNDNAGKFVQQQWQARQLPTLVLKHAGPESQWLCHGGRHHQRQRHDGNAAPTGCAASICGNDDNCANGGGKDNNDNDREEEDNHLSKQEVKYFLCHLLVVLDALHATSIMHMDVKPQNMLINCPHPSLGDGGSNPEDVRCGEGVVQMKDGRD